MTPANLCVQLSAQDEKLKKSLAALRLVPTVMEEVILEYVGQMACLLQRMESFLGVLQHI